MLLKLKVDKVGSYWSWKLLKLDVINVEVNEIEVVYFVVWSVTKCLCFLPIFFFLSIVWQTHIVS